jgi:uncharacterized protein (TIGR00290 family)
MSANSYSRTMRRQQPVAAGQPGAPAGQRRTVAFHWSGGKDSALALTRLLARNDVRVDRLVTTVDPQAQSSTVHELPVELLTAQAHSIGLPLQTVPMRGVDLDGYVQTMRWAAIQMRAAGIDAFAFGDLDCSGAREHHQAVFGSLGLDIVEPLEGLTSSECVAAFLDSGIRAVTVVVDARVLGPTDVGVPLDREFLDRLPAGADPAGEFGEYHSFVHDGPLFASPISFRLPAARRLDREISTTGGIRRYGYWVSTPQPAEWPGGTTSAGTAGGGGVPSPNGLPPKASRP